jgi:WD40 repeat protein
MQGGQQIFTTSSTNSGVTHFWDVRSGELVRTENLGMFCTSPDGSIAVGSGRAWELATGDIVGKFPDAWPYWLTAASISKDNKRMLLAYSADGISNDNPVQLRDLASGTLLQEFNGHEDWVVDVCFLGEHQILTASRDNTVRQWDAVTGQTTRQYLGHVDRVNDMAMSGDGKIILTSGARTDLGELEYQRVPELRLWNASSGQPIRTVTLGSLSRIDAVAISPDGLRAASSEGSSKVVLWDVSTGSPVRAYPLEGYSGGRLQFSPDGRKLLVKACGAAVHIVDLEVGDALSTLGTGSGGCVSDACFSPDSFKVLASGGNDHAYVWNLMTRERVLSLLGHADYVSAVSWSPDGTKLLTGSWDQTVRLWNAADGTLIETFNVGHVDDEVQSVDFSPDGSLIVVGWSGRPVAQLWRIDRKELLRTVEWPTTPGSSGPTRFFPSGFHFLSADLHVWEIRDLLAKPRLTRSHNDHQIHWDLGTLQFAPSVNGPWTALPAASPLRLSTIGEKGFFRVKVE